MVYIDDIQLLMLRVIESYDIIIVIQKGKEEANVEACAYPLKLLDSATCDDVALYKKYRICEELLYTMCSVFQ